ncbi:MAG: hypothetical protein ACE360_14175, partial [Hyphomicrobiales bacterium]
RSDRLSAPSLVQKLNNQPATKHCNRFVNLLYGSHLPDIFIVMLGPAIGNLPTGPEEPFC